MPTQIPPVSLQIQHPAPHHGSHAQLCSLLDHSSGILRYHDSGILDHCPCAQNHSCCYLHDHTLFHPHNFHALCLPQPCIHRLFLEEIFPCYYLSNLWTFFLPPQLHVHQ
uniref:Uncharacterized protein n=1 Tax=Opuntia streptacantha TaxID=393608 RepID=A0A7C8YWG8_OPUST